MLTYRQSPSLKLALLLAVVIGLYLFAFLGQRSLGVPSEARYAELPREMVASGDWVTPRLNGVKYFEKPPMIYWLQSSALVAFGNNEWAVRFWPAVMGLLGCLVTYAAGSLLYGRKTALLAALMLATGPIYFSISRIALTDMAVSTFMVSCLLCFIVAVDQPSGRMRRMLFYFAYVSAAFALLTKGLIGVAVPGAIVFLWLLITRRWAVLKTAYLPTGLTLLLALAVPWHVLAGLRTPEFWWFYFIHEHFLRYATSVSHRQEPWWFFIAIVAVNASFWLPCLLRSHVQALRAVWQAPRRESLTLFMVLAIFFPFLFFSASQSKLVPYIVPIFPFMSLVMADFVMRQLAAKTFRMRMPKTIATMAALLAVAVLLIMYNPALAAYLDEEDVAALSQILPWIACLFALFALGLFHAVWRRHAVQAVVIIVLASAGVNWFGDLGAARTQFKSVKAIAEYLKPRLKESDTVLTYRNYNQDLPFYLERTVTVVEWQGELEFGMSLERVPHMIDTDQFKKRWFSAETIYAVVRVNSMREFSADIGEKYRVVMATPRHLLLTNEGIIP